MSYKLKNTSAQVRVKHVRRLNNSIYGNPRFELITELGNYKTEPNAGWVYGIPFERLEGKTVLIYLSGRGNITNIEGEF